jgi:hypothetical protein
MLIYYIGLPYYYSNFFFKQLKGCTQDWYNNIALKKELQRPCGQPRNKHDSKIICSCTNRIRIQSNEELSVPTEHYNSKLRSLNV